MSQLPGNPQPPSSGCRFSGLLVNLGLGLALAGGLVYSSMVVTKSMERIRGTVDVKGYAERKIKADYVTWGVGVTVRNADLAGAYGHIEKNKDEVVKFIQDAQIKDAKLELGPIYKNTIYKRDDNGNQLTEVGAYELTQHVSITTTDIEKVKELALKIGALGAKGIEIEARAPAYLVKRENLEKAKIELLAEATKSARERADQFALNSGTSIGRLVSAHQGVFQVTAEDSTDVSDYGTYDTGSIDKILKIVVTLSYTTGG